MNEILSAFELIDEVGYELVLKELPTVARPLENKSPFYWLIETSGADNRHDQEKLEAFCEAALESIVTDGVMAVDEGQM